MSTEVVNLNKLRKERIKQERKGNADANAVKFGRSKAEKERMKHKLSKEMGHLEGHKRDP